MGDNAGRLLDLFAVLSEEIQNVQTNGRGESQRFAIDRLQSRMRKRAALGAPGLDTAAIDSFKATNLAVHGLSVSIDPFIEHNAKTFISICFERYNRCYDSTLIQVAFDHRRMDDFWRFGPGASNGVKGTHTAEKIHQSMSCTLLAQPLVTRLRAMNAYFRIYDTDPGNAGTTLVSGSRLTTVPKNEDTDRTIAIEPSGNMALQLGAGGYITEVLKTIGLDIRDQQVKNKKLARIGSIDGSLATIDMTAASDMFSIDLVRRLLPKGLFDYLLRIRSEWTQLPDGTHETLNMMSTMGNGFTFPMMTLIFTALVYANRLAKGGPNQYIDWSQTGIFGDDIIVPTDEAKDLITILEGCGFIVNNSKSYLEGPFRESCGGDYYIGDDVTPFYIRSLASDPDIYVAINKVFEWCAKTNVLLHQTITKLRSFLDGQVLFVPEWYGNDSGFRTTRVERTFKHYQVAKSQRRTKYPLFDMMLACGGYVNSAGPNLYYTPRPFKTRYKVRKARMPSGFLDGADPLSRSVQTTVYIEAYAFLLFA